MKINTYLDSTYLKTPAQSGLTEEQTLETVINLAKEAICVLNFSLKKNEHYI